jgi:hypothetical protein
VLYLWVVVGESQLPLPPSPPGHRGRLPDPHPPPVGAASATSSASCRRELVILVTWPPWHWSSSNRHCHGLRPRRLAPSSRCSMKCFKRKGKGMVASCHAEHRTQNHVMGNGGLKPLNHSNKHLEGAYGHIFKRWSAQQTTPSNSRRRSKDGCVLPTMRAPSSDRPFCRPWVRRNSWNRCMLAFL